ncbi:unnamed protein product [Rodentolepis nana]|uniref:Secreted protein n=1 Tax=Rodentolepis nana TaxID=102285 RepID=A0A0R3TEV1_RODNA|nr:unnamed protein product [Rodentolepis nana]
MWVECILSICEGVLMVECILPIFEGVLPGNPSVRSLNSATASILGQSLRLSNGFDSWPVGYVESATVHCFSFVRASSNGFDSWPVGSKSATVHCFSFLRGKTQQRLRFLASRQRLRFLASRLYRRVPTVLLCSSFKFVAP